MNELECGLGNHPYPLTPTHPLDSWHSTPSASGCAGKCHVGDTWGLEHEKMLRHKLTPELVKYVLLNAFSEVVHSSFSEPVFHPPACKWLIFGPQKCKFTVYTHDLNQRKYPDVKKQAESPSQSIRVQREEWGLCSRWELIWIINQTKLMTDSGGGALLLPRINTQIWTSEWGLTLQIIWFTLTAAANADLADGNLTPAECGAVQQLIRLACVRRKEQELWNVVTQLCVLCCTNKESGAPRFLVPITFFPFR